MGLASHAPVPFLDKATSSIWVGTDDVLLYHGLLTRQNVVFIQGFGGEKEGKQAKVGTTQVPEYVSGVLHASLGYLHAGRAAKTPSSFHPALSMCFPAGAGLTFTVRMNPAL